MTASYKNYIVVSNTKFSNNDRGILHYGGDLQLYNTIIEGTSEGATLHAEKGTITIDRSVFQDNYSPGAFPTIDMGMAGAISIYGGNENISRRISVSISNSVITDPATTFSRRCCKMVE